MDRPNSPAPLYPPSKAEGGADHCVSKKKSPSNQAQDSTASGSHEQNDSLPVRIPESLVPRNNSDNASYHSTTERDTLDTSARTALSESEKTRLAMSVSAAVTTSIPGAHHSSGSSTITALSQSTGKPSQEQLIQRAQLQTEQKMRMHCRTDDDLDDSDRLPLDSESQVLDQLQDRMNGFRVEVEKEDLAEMENLKKMKWKRRRFLILILSGVFLAIIAMIVGLIVGLAEGNNGLESEEMKGDLDSPYLYGGEQCFVGNLANQSDRFLVLRSILVKYDPTIDIDGSTSRVALCWLAFHDQLQLRAEETQEYQLVQRFALVVTYYHFGRRAQETNLQDLNWLSHSSVCDWERVECKAFADLGLVDSLVLDRLDLAGSIPTQLALLTSLSHLLFGDNYLTGSIPTQLWSLTLLETLSFGTNFLTGFLSQDINRLKRLSLFQIDTNTFRGSIPDLKLDQLTQLDLAASGFTGSFPDISSLTNLESLALPDLVLSGRIPLALFDLKKLKLLSLSATTVSGTIPSEIEALSALEFLDLSYTFLSGTIPTEFGKLSVLKHLELQVLNAIGSIPSELGLLTKLESLQIYENTPQDISNQLNFDIPEEVCSLRSLSLSELVGDCRFNCSCCTSCK